MADVGRLIREAKPDLVTMENVPQLLDHEVFARFLDDLDGFKIWHGVVDCTQYGVPQTRKRLVLLASRLGPIELLPPSAFEWQPTTVRQAIFHLPSLEAGESHPTDKLHAASSLSDLNLRRIKASKPGGTWRVWDDELRASR